jgi:hypothetical protein
MAGIGSSLLSAQTTVTNIVVSTQDIENASMPTKDTEYSYALPVGTKWVICQNRQDGLIKITATSGESGTNYFTIFPGQQREYIFLNSNTAQTLYFQSPKDNQLLEIESWS